MSSEVARQYVPYLVAFNLSDRCNLSCAHCYMDAAQKATAGDGELRFSELAALFADIGREAPGTIAVLTGGEPLMRPDIEGLVDAGRDAGLRMVIGTNGVLLTKTKIRRFKELGLEGVG
ncbi:MAG: radical SAM protein, partial [Candidatus Latescibacteria bacterium]|nr:radical SAM protein [Candidatus Latescibacterota bacterium]